MKQSFALFAGTDQQPQGGWRDLVDTFTSLEQGLNVFQSQQPHNTWSWAMIMDLELGDVVWQTS